MSIRIASYIFFIIATIALISFDLYKAAHASFTHDESFTYLHYVHQDIMEIVSYKDAFTNNHILNTLLMKLFETLFGTSELILRLPNILAHLLYLFFTFKLFERYTPSLLIPFFILANANPFLIDFFSLARGYGLAIGLMITALYCYCRYIETQKPHHHLIALILMGLATLANFALLNIFLILILMHNFFQFFIHRKSFSLKNLWTENKINIVIITVMGIILYEPIRKIIKFHLVDFGGPDGFWEDTVRSLLYSTAYLASYEASIKIFGKICIIFFTGLFVFQFLKYIFSKGIMQFTQKLVLFFGLTIFLLILGSITQHLLFDTPFLKGRFAVFLYPLFILVICFQYKDFFEKMNKILRFGLISLIASVFFLHTLNTLTTKFYYEWLYDMNTKEMLKELDDKYSKSNSSISIGISWLFEPGINFYKESWDLQWLREADRNGFKPENDYYYSLKADLKNLHQQDLDTIKVYPITNNRLIRHNKQ